MLKITLSTSYCNFLDINSTSISMKVIGAVIMDIHAG